MKFIHYPIFLSILFSYSEIFSSENEIKNCGNPGFPIHGAILPDKDSYLRKETVIFRCDKGYVLLEKANLTCEGNNTWSSPVPYCGFNAALGKRTKCLEKEWKHHFSKNRMFRLTDARTETCETLRINKRLKLTAELPKMNYITSIKVYANEIKEDLHILVKFMDDVSEKICQQHFIESKYWKLYVCDPKVESYSKTLDIIFISSVELNLTLCEIKAFSNYGVQIKFVERFTQWEEELKMVHCLQNFTDGNFSSVSKINLNEERSILIKLHQVYNIEKLVLALGLPDRVNSEIKNNFSLTVETGNESSQQQPHFRLCNKGIFVHVDVKRYTNFTFTCFKQASIGDAVRLNFSRNTGTELSLVEFQVLTTGLHSHSSRRCLIIQRSSNCEVKTMFDSQENQYLLYSPKSGHYLKGQTEILCENGKWKHDPPRCLPFRCQTDKTESNSSSEVFYRSDENFFSIRCSQFGNECLKWYEDCQWANYSTQNLRVQNCSKEIIVSIICTLLIIGIFPSVYFFRRKCQNITKKSNKIEKFGENVKPNEVEEVENPLYESIDSI